MENENELKYTIIDLCKEMNMCAKNKLYIAAIYIALSIPDICSKLEGDRREGKIRYPSWCNKWMNEYYINMKPDFDGAGGIGEFIYQLRNSAFHEGKIGYDERNGFDYFVIDGFNFILANEDYAGEYKDYSFSGDTEILKRECNINDLRTKKKLILNIRYFIDSISYAAIKFCEAKGFKDYEITSFKIKDEE